MKTISFEGRQWRLHSKTKARLIFHADNSASAKELKNWRQRNNFNQRAAAAKLGISQGQLARIESGTRTLSSDLFSKISK